jgi:hypothetical protein
MQQHHPLFVYANLTEAALWIALAVAVLFRAKSWPGRALAAALVLFGISDLVETRTGAWYEPWWLLA